MSTTDGYRVETKNAVPCPNCGAEITRKCLNLKTGEETDHIHVDRRRIAKRLAQEAEALRRKHQDELHARGLV